MAIIDTNHYVDLKETTDGPALNPGAYSATSSDPTVASIGVGANGQIAVVGQSNGDFTVTVHRNSDGATASISDSVGEMGGTFSVVFGDVHPKG